MLRCSQKALGVVGGWRAIVIEFDRSKPVDCFLQTFSKRDFGLPTQFFFGEANVGATARGIICRQGLTNQLRLGTGHLQHQIGQFANGELARVAYVDRSTKASSAFIIRTNPSTKSSR